MSETRVSHTARKSILSSLSALGASQSPVRTETIPRSKILGTLAAAGASLAVVQSAEAGIVVENPDVNVGYAAGDIASFKLNLASLKSNTLNLVAFSPGPATHGLFFAAGPPVYVRANSSVAVPTGGGKKFSAIGSHAGLVTAVIAGRTSGGGVTVPNFSDKYYSFSFLDSSSQLHYGWIYGSLGGGYNDLTYNLISYAYDTTPNEMIVTGQTVIPEPSSLVLGAIASLVLGAAAVRRWKKDQQAKAKVV